MKIKWKCKLCNDIIISDSEEHHKMDSCKCEKCSCDLENYYCRWGFENSMDDIKILEEMLDWKNEK